MKWNKWLILTVALVLVALPFAYSDSYWDYLTRGLADQLYCKISDGCGGVAGGANLTGVGSTDNIAIWYNATHLTYNTSVIGGSGTGDNVSFNESMIKEYIIYVNGTAAVLDDYCNTDGKILKRIGGEWVCADDATSGGTAGGDGSIDSINMSAELREEAIYIHMYIPNLA